MYVEAIKYGEIRRVWEARLSAQMVTVNIVPTAIFPHKAAAFMQAGGTARGVTLAGDAFGEDV